MGGIRKKAVTEERSAYATKIKAYAALYRNPSDPVGEHRHELGGINEGLFDNLPAAPAPGLVNVKWQIFQFSGYPEIITDAVDATNHMWVEENVNDGAPLALDTTVPGGAAKMVTDTGTNDHYYYQAYQKLAKGQQGKDFWWEITLVPTGIGATLSGLFVGVCATVAMPDDIFGDRVDSIGFFNYYDGEDVGFEVRVGGVAQQASVSILRTAQLPGGQGVDFEDDVEIKLGFRYYSAGQQCAYYANDEYAGRIRVDAAAVMMPTTFGMITKEDAEKTLLIKHIVLGVEV